MHEFISVTQIIAPAALTAFSAFVIALIFTRRIKRAETMIECSRRFQDLYLDRHELHRRVMFDSAGNIIYPPPQYTARDRADASNWYWRLFSLVESEFDFFVDGLIRPDRFVVWMKWRRLAFSKPNSNLCGLRYQEAWEGWKKRTPLAESQFVAFLDKVHDQRAGSEESLVRKLKRRHWWRL